MWPSNESYPESNPRSFDRSLFGQRFGDSELNVCSGDQDTVVNTTRTQLLWGENALLCGDFDEASRIFLQIITSFEQNNDLLYFKDRSAMAGAPSSLSVPLAEGCRVHGQQPHVTASTPLQQEQLRQQQQEYPYHQQHPQQEQHEQRQRRRQQQVVTLLGSALYGLGTTYMLQGYFDHAQPVLQQAVYLYWRLYGEGSPLLELARIQLHRLHCYWEMVQQQEQQMQQRQWLMPGAYQPHQPPQQQQRHQLDELSLTEHFRQHENAADDDDDDDQFDEEIDVFDDDFDNDDMFVFPEHDDFDETEEDFDDEHHRCCYCPGEICRMFSRSVRHAAAA